MKRFFPGRWLFSLLSFALAALVFRGGAPLHAEDDEDEKPRAVPGQIQPEQFDLWLFGNSASTKAVDRLDAQLTVHVDEIRTECAATAAQVQKLQLAGQGDIKHFLDEMDDARRKFESLRHDNQKIGEMFGVVQPLKAKLDRGMFQEGSLSAKARARTLSAEQLAKYDQRVAARRAFRYRAGVELAVGLLDELVTLRAEQRRRLIEVLLERTPPPKKTGTFQSTLQWVLGHAARLPEKTFTEFLDDHQYRGLRRLFDLLGGRAPENGEQGELP